MSTINTIDKPASKSQSKVQAPNTESLEGKRNLDSGSGLSLKSSLPLTHQPHPPNPITFRESEWEYNIDIIAHTKADNFEKEIFGEHGMFFKNTDLKGGNRETLLGSVLNLGRLKEREEIREIIKTIEENKSPNTEDTQFRMKQVKSSVASSVGLRDCLKIIEEQFAWIKEKMVFMITMSVFIYIFMGTALYSLDVYTDVNFSFGMFSQSRKNFTKEREICKKDFVC